MIFWLDAHLDSRLAPWLGARYGVIVKDLHEIDLRNAEDDELFEAARRFNEIVIVTKDRDLPEIVGRKGSPPQVLWLRFTNRSLVQMQILLSRAFPNALSLLEGGEQLVEISEDSE
jgi:predicted nuclease of predicted toxin-antitoxin system